MKALDRILHAQALSVEDLAVPDRLPGPEAMQTDTMDIVPIVSQTMAMNAPVISARARADNVQLPSGWLAALPARRAVSRRSWERFVAVRITAAQALSMDPLLRVASVVILDRHYNSLAVVKPPHPNVYAVRVGSQLAFRHVSFEASRLVLRPRSFDYPVELLELAPQETPSDLLVGRVCFCLAEL